MKTSFVIEHKDWTLTEIAKICSKEYHLSLSLDCINLIQIGRKKLDQKIEIPDLAIYGINTGFGSLCNTIIESNSLDQLQINLIRSHACGTGSFVSSEISRLILLLKIISLSKGNSCVRIELVNFLLELFNHDLLPAIPEMGSLGASGDLAPLAHLSLLTIGEGEILNSDGSTSQLVKEILESKNIHIPMLRAKEGLAMLNGTQFSLAVLFQAINSTNQLYHLANLGAALSMEAYYCSMDFLHEEIHKLRRQKGQINAAKEISKLLSDGQLNNKGKNYVQDPYSFRCIPQVHGASLDVFQYVNQIVENEINSVTDNPVMLSDGQILSGGNFHAQPLALAADFLSIAVSELGNISERRIYQLINGNRGLPEFLTSNPGLNSGYMIVQYSAASLVSMNKQLCSPSSIDSIVTSKGQEDHVSMAANAALKCYGIVERTFQIVAMEWMTACRAWDYRKETNQLGHTLEKFFSNYRSLVAFKETDHIPSLDYKPTLKFLRNISFVE
ncbi:MAG: histidine ammonia-lyase [Saprospiraceae bacterium]